MICRHEPCTCTTVGEPTCSPHCSTATNAPGLPCECGHPECAGLAGPAGVA